jgi:F-type H+-transporting ATPase subunit b
MLRRIVLFLAMSVMLLSLLAPVAFGADPAHPTAEHSQPPLLANPLAGDEHGRAARLQAVWVLIIFVVLLAILYPTAWKNVLAGLKAREQRIRADIAEAEQARVRAEATLKEYNAQLAAADAKVRDMIAGAVTQGERVAADIRARAVAEADESRQRALREIEGARKQALAEIYERAAELSTGIAEKILRRNINVDDQRDLVRRSLEELQTVQR